MARERSIRESEERERVEMRGRLDVWDDDESDEMFYVDRYVLNSDLGASIYNLPQVAMASP